MPSGPLVFLYEEQRATQREDGPVRIQADWSALAVLMPRIAGHHQKLEERRGTDFVVLSCSVYDISSQRPW